MVNLHQRPAAVLAGVVLALVALAGMITIARLSTVEPEPAPAARVQPTAVAAPTVAPVASAPTVASDRPFTDALLADASMPDRLCALPEWSDDPQHVEAHVLVALGCLNAAWQPVLAELNISFAPAQVASDPTEASSRCARPPEPTSFYCDGTIYLVESSYRETNTGARGIPAAAFVLLAHEYGHHVQRLAGTLDASATRIAAAGPETPAGQELTRRVELQAQCFAGVFMSAAADGDTLDFARRDSYSRGDSPGRPRTHGTSQNFGDWFTVGAVRNSLAACDTWSAPAESVA